MLEHSNSQYPMFELKIGKRVRELPLYAARLVFQDEERLTVEYGERVRINETEYREMTPEDQALISGAIPDPLYAEYFPVPK